MSSNLVLKTAAAVFLVATSAFAHSDVLVREVGGKVAIGTADVDNSVFELGPNVFEAVFIDVAPSAPFNFEFSRTEPGFFSPAAGIPAPGSALPTSADVTLSLSPFNLGAGSSAVHYWDGTGPVSFAPLAQAGVAYNFFPPTFATTSAVDGAFDDHPEFGLQGPAANGVYLTSHVLDVDGLQQSDPFYLVWLADSVIDSDPVAEAVEVALEELEENGTPAIVSGVDFSFYEEAVEFAETIPEPSTGLLMLTALLGALGVRRR